jgi:hypothetical protein
MLNFRKIREEGLHWTILWDIILLLVAVTNLTLISFDLLYLRLRPHLFYYAPELVQQYDQLKGIEEHPFTTDYLQRVRAIRGNIEGDLRNGPVFSNPTRSQLTELTELSTEMLRQNPFQTAGLTRNLDKIRGRLRQYVTSESGEPMRTYALAFEYFWDMNPGNYSQRLDFFEREIAPLLEVNYFRHRDIDGDFIDLYWEILDLPFLLFFLFDFVVRFLLFFRKARSRWFLFLVYNWYDFLSLFPSSWLRLLRLFRIMAIWARLRRSELLAAGDGLIVGGFNRYRELLSREVSGMVAIQIISQLQAELEKQSDNAFWAEALEPHRGEIKEVVLEQCQHLTRSQILPFKPRFAELVRVSLEKTLQTSAFRFIPNAVARPVLQKAGADIVDSIFETISSTVESPEGRAAIEGIVDQALDSFRSSGNPRTATMMQKWTHNALEELKGGFVDQELMHEGSKSLQQQLSELAAILVGDPTASAPHRPSGSDQRR